MNLIDLVELFARDAHKNVFRRGGLIEYVEHSIAVSKIVSDLIDGQFYWISSLTDREHLRKLVKILALIHDIPEDVEEFKNNEVKVINVIRTLDHKNELSEKDFVYLTAALKNLNKNNFKNYCEFVLAAKSVVGSRLVKLADIIHNSSDLTRGALLDKYLLAKYILEN